MPDTNTLDSNRTDKNVTFLKVAISSLIPEECKFKFERNVFEKFDEYEKSYPVIYKNYAEYEKKKYLNFVLYFVHRRCLQILYQILQFLMTLGRE